MKYEAYEYQKAAERWIIKHPRCALFLDMGLGKTVITLTAMQRLIDYCEVSKVLVIAPKKVAEATWSTEADKWDHLSGLRVAKVLGTERQRISALNEPADIYVVGRDSFVWLMGYYNGRLPFDVIVIDELTSFKSPTSKRFKAMRIATAGVSRVIGLTGTPAPNGYIDLWAQMYCIDQGLRLGKSVTRYRDTYFDIQRWNNIVVKCKLKKACEAVIRERISDICLSMQAKDYLQLPELIIHTERVQLSSEVKKKYEEFEREKVLEFRGVHPGEEPANVLATSAAALVNKLSQFANGAIYDGDLNVHELHDEKIARLEELVEAANGSVLVFYQYKHDAARIAERLSVGREVRVYHDEKDLEAWNQGKIDVLLAHPASTAYGLNMQGGGHYIVWFGTGWNLEHFQQGNARLYRQGQTRPVIVYKLICASTIDEESSVCIEGKASTQQSLLDSLNYLLEKYKDEEEKVESDDEQSHP